MKKFYSFCILLIMLGNPAFTSQNHTWKAKWITSAETQSKSNSWTVFHNTVNITERFSEAYVYIAADSKYWLWINGELVVFEGALKRGPNYQDTYYDRVEVGKFLKRGVNDIAVLAWYFGKNGFSHHSSGKAGFLFELYTDKKLQIVSDRSWLAIPHPAYRQFYEGTQPTYRLAESNIVFDARMDQENFTTRGYKSTHRNSVMEIGGVGIQPWNQLHQRPIPLWINKGLKNYTSAPTLPFVATADTIRCRLPYNSQVTPFIKVKAPAGLTIHILSDNYESGGNYSIRTEYITREGLQEFESLAWINGHEILYVVPEGIEVLELKYRETGFDTELNNKFVSSDNYLNKLWEKAQRTLYLNMRDNFMTNPDTERAQAWESTVNQIQESFYGLCPQSHSLARKAMFELIGWQQEDGTLFSPVPAGNYNDELPLQMLHSIGYYGFWNYFLHTGDTTTIREVLPGTRRYLELWETSEIGLVGIRQGNFQWADAGEHKDMEVLYNTWYFLACRGYALMAEVLEQDDERIWAEEKAIGIREHFNNTFWTGTEYRSPDYKGETDDRANALAVLAGFADPDYFPILREVFAKNQHASPHMEKYILEALFAMGYNNLALERMKQRYLPMIDSELTTLWDSWELNTSSSTHHAWGGGALSLLSKYTAGITPASAGFESITIRPQMGTLTTVIAEINTVKGIIRVENDMTNPNVFVQIIKAPAETQLQIIFPENRRRVVSVTINDEPLDKQILDNLRFHNSIQLPGGDYHIVVRY